MMMIHYYHSSPALPPVFLGRLLGLGDEGDGGDCEAIRIRVCHIGLPNSRSDVKAMNCLTRRVRFVSSLSFSWLVGQRRNMVMCGVRVCCVFVCPFVEKVVSFRIEVTTPYCANHLPRPLFLTTRENVEGYYGSFSSLILIKKRIPLSPQINILLVNIRRLEGNTISETHKSHIHNQSNLVHVTKQCRTHSGFRQYTIKTIALKR